MNARISSVISKGYVASKREKMTRSKQTAANLIVLADDEVLLKDRL